MQLEFEVIKSEIIGQVIELQNDINFSKTSCIKHDIIYKNVI